MSKVSAIVVWSSTLLVAWGCAGGPRHYETGMRHLGNAKYVPAVQEFTLAIEQRDHVAFAYISRGDAHMAMEKFEEAIADYTEAIRLLPTSFWSYGRRAKAHLNLGNPEGFQADWAKAQEFEREAKGSGFIFRASTDEVTFADLSGDIGVASAQASEGGEIPADGSAEAAEAVAQGNAVAENAGGTPVAPAAPDVLTALNPPPLVLQPEEMGGAGATPAMPGGSAFLVDSYPPRDAGLVGPLHVWVGRVAGTAAEVRLDGRPLTVDATGRVSALLWLPHRGWNIVVVDFAGPDGADVRVTLVFVRVR